jgi:hypothetical protein
MKDIEKEIEKLKDITITESSWTFISSMVTGYITDNPDSKKEIIKLYRNTCDNNPTIMKMYNKLKEVTRK